MAYAISQTRSHGTASVSTQTLSLPSGGTSGDTYVVCVSHYNSSAASLNSGAGWNAIGAPTANGTAAQSWFWALHGVGNPTFNTSNGSQGALVFDTWIIRGAANPPLSTVSGTDFKQTNHTAVWSATSGALTPSAANALLLYGFCINTTVDSSQKNQPSLDSTSMYVDATGLSSGTGIAVTVGHVQTGSVAAAPASKVYINDRGNGALSGVSWIVAILDDGTSKLQPDVRPGVDILALFGDYGKQNDGITYLAPRQFPDGGTTTSIGGVTTSSTTLTPANALDPANPPGFCSYVSSVENTAGAWVGVSYSRSAIDLTGKVFRLQWSVDSTANVDSTNGWCVGFSDGGSNWVVYQLSKPVSTTPLKDAWSYNQIALGAATALYSGGTVATAISACTRVAIFWHRNNSTGSGSQIYFKNAFLQGASVFVGGNVSAPVTTQLLPNLYATLGHFNLTNLQGSGQVLGKAKVQIGDGSTPTYTDLSAYSFEYPQAYNADNSNRYWNANASSMEVRVKTSASDNLKLTADIFATSFAQPFVIDAASTTPSSASMAGASFIGYDVTWKTGITCNSCTFKSGGIIDFKGADLVNVIANSGTGTALMSASSGFSATGCTFTASSTAVYGIRIAAAGTFDLASTTFSGFTKDIDVTATTGTVTINLADGQATPTYQTAGATVTLVSSPVFQSVTITGFTAGSRIWIKDVTSGNVLFNGTASAGDTVISGSSCVWTDPSAASASRQIALRVAYQSTTTAKAFVDVANIGTCGTSAGSEDVAYIVAQENDTTYNSNGIDGSGVADITFTDATPDLVVCNLAGGSTTYPRLYAAFVYWMFTSTGIDDDNTYIDAPDTANYLFTAMKIQNSSTTPLTITGGYGRSATSGLVADIIDVAGSAGNIYPQPDHVVAYQTTGTYAITGDISTVLTSIGTVPAAVLSAAQAAPIHSDVRKVKGTTVTGSGSDADPWGP